MTTNPTGSTADDLLMFDLETSGLDPRVHEILEIGAVRLTDDLRQKGEFVCKVQPLNIAAAMPEALAVNGYTAEQWRDAVPIRQALEQFVNFGDGAMLAGYNLAFDWEFLHAALSVNDIPAAFPYHRFDVFSLVYEWALKRGISTPLDLQSVCRQFGITPPPTPHRALEDARAEAALLRALRRSSPGI